MHPLTPLLFLLPVAISTPSNPNLQPRKDAWTLDCTDDYSSSPQNIMPYNRLDWKSQMTDCMNQMDNSGWNGAHCTPSEGPSFGFWKGETHNEDGKNCFDICQPCIAQAIRNGRGVSTSCTYTDKVGPSQIGVTRWTCNMGFDYGG